MKNVQLLYLCLLLMAVFSSCGNKPDVYVTGFETLKGNKKAIFWKNGKQQYLLDNSFGERIEAKTVYVSGNDVYVFGINRKDDIPILWKNGIEQDLAVKGADVKIVSVYVLNDDIYMAGFKESEMGVNVARIWKNGVEQKLVSRLENEVEVECYNAYAHQVFVVGDDVYVVGQHKNIYDIGLGANKEVYLLKNIDKQEPKIAITLWENGVGKDITDGTCDAFVESIFVYANDVYIVGYEYNAQGKSEAKLWKNGVAQNLQDGKYAYSVFVYGENIYVAGTNYNNKAILWKNGKKQELGNGEAYAVFTHGNDVYVTGYETNAKGIIVAKLWKNGKAKNLTDEKNSTVATSVFVQ